MGVTLKLERGEQERGRRRGLGPGARLPHGDDLDPGGGMAGAEQVIHKAGVPPCIPHSNFGQL